jgi:hypothetical protein
VRAFVGAVILMVVAAAGYALWLAGSPSVERAKRLDAQRVGDLQGIASNVDSYFVRNGKVPVALADIKGGDGAYFTGRLTDPETGAPYEYRATDEAGYELCAVFEKESEPAKPGMATPYGYYGPEWDHAAGRDCFELDAALRQPRSACSLTSPCAAGQNCVTLGDGQGPVCVPAGKECLAAGCANGKCVVAESYPAQVRCME